jgi:putative (di)nucleoside polyphosphate hydrolase
MIDSDGFRFNVGIILTNDCEQVFWARRVGMDAWQFPQGGMKRNETPESAMFRELREEVGLLPEHVEIMGCTRRWLRYRIPRRFIRYNKKPVCIGQKQLWYVLRFTGHEADVRLDCASRPEFDDWTWIDYWRPAEEDVSFKREVYRKALSELAPLVFPVAGALLGQREAEEVRRVGS